ncbi:MAG: Ppx/GppA phosphatase family protein [Bacteroidota bacterium]
MAIPSDNSPATIATIDVGTNTALLLISKFEDGRLISLYDETRFVRLGQGVDKDGFVNAAAMDRLTKTLAYYKGVATQYNVDDIIIGATSASRDAVNKADLIAHVRNTTGLTYDIISGETEAQLSFAGVGAGQTVPHPAILTLDIGGGSTEFSLGLFENGTYNLSQAQSLNVGSVRLTERFFSALPPDRDMLTQAKDWLSNELEALLPEFQRTAAVLIGASGTTTVLAMLDAKLTKADLKNISMLGQLSREQVGQWYEQLIQLPAEEVLALGPEFMKGREDVFAAGLFILHTCMTHLDKPQLHVNTWGLRHGLALRYWQQQG